MEDTPTWGSNTSTLSQEISSAFYGTWRFITVFPILYTPVYRTHPTYLVSILISSSHLLLGRPSGFFPTGLLFKTLYVSLFSLIGSTWLPRFILIDLITEIIFGDKNRSRGSSAYSFVQPSVSSSLSGPNIFLSTLFSNIRSLYPSLNVKYQVSHPYKKQ
jgi:hypothetical protein